MLKLLNKLYRSLFVKYAVYKIDNEGPGIFIGRLLSKTINESSKSSTIRKVLENISFEDKNKSVVKFLEDLGYSLHESSENINNMIMIRPPELILNNRIKKISLFEYYAIVGCLFKAAGYNVAVRCVKTDENPEFNRYYLIIIHRKEKYWLNKVDKYATNGKSDIYSVIGGNEKNLNIRVAKDILCFN